MALAFRYRYVDIGTVFTGDSRRRDAHAGADSPSTLFANELACDVGGTCWGANEPLAILDHHPAGEAQFPSACAAVLHKSKLIRDRFAQLDDVVWLVTHKDPDFDGFCAMYLARCLIAGVAPGLDWENYGLHQDGWLDLPTRPKIDWLNPQFSGIPAEYRWPLLLAAYASRVEMRRPIPCPRERALRSVLFAALKRGRDYLDQASGATEFFDEVRNSLQDKQRNPVYESVLEESAQFAPELAMLGRESAAYERDLERARKALVYLPEAEAPSPDFFERPKKILQPAEAGEPGGEGLLLADSFRIASDGIYLRDPECSLFEPWARVDLENSALGAGFDFTAVAFSRTVAQGAPNSSEYVFSIDPGRANGRHLFTVWSRLQTEELEAMRARQAVAQRSRVSERQPGQRAETVETLLSDPWIGGQSRSSTLVETPRRGTSIAPAGVRSDLRDDPVVEAVRTELEAPLYSSPSHALGPQITVYDFAVSGDARNPEPLRFAFNSPLTVAAPAPNHFRFASIGLRADVPIVNSGRMGERLAQQIGEFIWHALQPETRGQLPQDFARRLVVRPDAVGIWSERGVAVAHKRNPLLGEDQDADASELADFTALMSLVRGIDRLTSEANALDLASSEGRRIESGRKPANSAFETVAAEGETLARRALELQHMLLLPERELLRRFCEAIGWEQLLGRLRDLNQAAAEHVRREAAAEEARRQGKRADESARFQGRLRWLEVVIIGFVALEIIGILQRNVNLSSGVQQTLAWLGGPLALGCAAWLLQPWKTRRRAGREETGNVKWILLTALLVWVAVWVSQVVRAG